MPERTDFLEGDAPAAAKVEAFLARALEATGSNANITAGALVPWICDALLSNHSVKAYGRDLMDFVRHMQAQGVDPLHVTADHVKMYKRALLEAGLKSATVARRLSVLRGTYHQLAAKGLIAWETAQDIAAVKAPGVQNNSTPSLTEKQAIRLLEAIPSDTLQGIRDLALMSVFFLTGCRVSAVVAACVGHLETDGVEHYLHSRSGPTSAITLLEQITIAKVIHRGAEPIGAVHLGNSSQFPEGVLEPLAEALETLGKADCGSLPIRIGQDKVIDHVIKRFTSQRDVQVVHVREVGGSQLAGPMDLIEKDLLGWTLSGSPRFDLPLQGAELDVGKSAWETTLKVLEEGLGLEPGIEFQQITKLGPNVLERILPGPPGSWGQRFTRQAISMPVLSS